MKIDLAPIYRSTVGFDNLASVLDSVFSADTSASSYPPYNIEVIGENKYTISLAVAGFQEDDFDIEVEKGLLTVRGKKSEDNVERQYLYQGIAARDFERKFNLADYVEVSGASYKNGLLTITLEKQLPEEMKPRRIPINTSENVIEHQQQEEQKAA